MFTRSMKHNYHMEYNFHINMCTPCPQTCKQILNFFFLNSCQNYDIVCDRPVATGNHL